MRKQFVIENLDCAHCAMKMEEAAGKVDGVDFVSINFLSMKLTLEAEESRFSEVFAQVEKVCREIERDVKFYENKYRLTKDQTGDVVGIGICLILFLLANILNKTLSPENQYLSSALFLPAYLVAGISVLRKAFFGLFHKKFFDENFLMALATFGAFAVGEGSEGVMVMLLYRIGEFLQDLAVAKSRKNVTELMDIRPDCANLIEGDSVRIVKPEEVKVGEVILIKPGEKIPLDGTVVSGASFLDTAAITGESVPREVKVGDRVISGCINMNGPLTLRVEESFENSSVSKILQLIENAGGAKSSAEKLISRFAKVYTPFVVILALVIATLPPLFLGNCKIWLHKAITCLVISCPCALVISVPLTFFGGIGCCSSRGILVKGAQTLEKMAKSRLCAFDKTGTLTQGVFQVTAIHPEKIEEEALLEIAATCEHYSDHPISRSLKRHFSRDIDKSRIGKIQEIPGGGVMGEIDGKTYFVGNESFMSEAGITPPPCALCHHKGTIVHVAEEGEYLGHILISDRIRPDAKKAVENLKKAKVSQTLLLSGDDENVARRLGEEIGIDRAYGNLLPQDKLQLISKLQTENPGDVVIFVGDGINDTPVLSQADVGVAMGGIGADAALEAADVVLMDDKPSKIAQAIGIAKKTMGIVWQNIFLSIGVKLFVLIPNIFLGEESVPIALAIFADVGVCLIAILNAARALRHKEK